ncbi:MAG: hypothetical protein HY712_05830 [candidate division NC10 bacterium]|nr:hypothetical protein [candidate division NC10 bacterium]
MQCRHTVAEWHRYADAEGASLPIFAACRLLIKEGEQARDPKSIACGYWGRQRECPLYEGPGGRIEVPQDAAGPGVSQEVRIALEAVWPVRHPGAVDGFRLLVTGLTALSVGLLAWSILLGVAVLGGHGNAKGFIWVALMAASFSMATHLLAALKTWAGR